MENNYRFFSNIACDFFPCHQKPDPHEFNCLFCYCPLYLMGKDCGGLFEMTHGVKDCTECHLPHTPAYYDVIVKKLGDKISEGIC